MNRLSLVARLPLPARLAARQLERERLASILSIMALALPSTAALAAYLVVRSSQQASESANGGPGRIVYYDPVVVGPEFLLTLAPIAAVIAIIVATILGATTLVRSRSQDRTLALLEAAGAGRTLRFRIASARGVLLGLTAAVLSALLGVGGCAIVELFVPGRAIGSLAPVVLVLSSGAAIPLAWLASVAPVLQRRPRTMVAELHDRPLPMAPRVTHSKSGGIYLLMALVLALLVGAATLVTESEPTPGGFLRVVLVVGTIAVLPAVVLFIVGTSMQAPAAAGAFARALGRNRSAFALPARLAARDAATSSARTVPVVAAILIICFVFSHGLITSRANAEKNGLDYTWALQVNQVSMNLIETNWNEETNFVNPATTAHAVQFTAAFDDLFNTDSRTLRAVEGPYYGEPADDGSGRQAMVFPEQGLPTPRVASSGPCQGGNVPPGVAPAQCRRDLEDSYDDGPASAEVRFPLSDVERDIWVGDLADLALMIGHEPNDETRDAFDRGDALLFDARLLDDRSQLTLDWYGADQFVAQGEPGEFLPSGTPLRTRSVPATIIPLEHRIFADVFLSDVTAASLQLRAEPSLVLAQLDSIPSDDSWYGFDTMLMDDYNFDTRVTVESGPSQTPLPVVLAFLAIGFGISLVIALVAGGLARFENRPAVKTLLSLGARPGIGSRISGWYSLIVVGFASLTGTLMAVLLNLGLWPRWVNPFWPGPLLEVGVLGIGLPLLAAAIARALPDGQPRGGR